MKYSTIYPITAAQITAQYRLTIDGLLTFHESTIARYLTTLNLDFNGHTNNRRYVQMALVCFPPEFLATHRPEFLNIRFIKESRLGETVVNETHPTDNPDTFVGLVMNESGQELCRVSSHWLEKEPLPDIATVNLVRNPAE